MSDFVKIRCQKDKCPYGKNHCCFGEVQRDCISKAGLVERHKCEYAKDGADKYVLIVLKAA